MLEKAITIGDKQVKFRSSATIPRLYRAKFKRDIFKDLSRLESSYKGNSDDGSSFEIEDLEIFENVAYIMAYHADHSIPATGIAVLKSECQDGLTISLPARQGTNQSQSFPWLYKGCRWKFGH